MTYWQFQKGEGNKYKAKSTEYGGRVFHSKLEAGYAETLDWRIKAKEVKSWRPQVHLPIRYYGQKICTYIIDFEVILSDKSIEYVEVKGFSTDVWKQKWKMVEALLDHAQQCYNTKCSCRLDWPFPIPYKNKKSISLLVVK